LARKLPGDGHEYCSTSIRSRGRRMPRTMLAALAVDAGRAVQAAVCRLKCWDG
jgi:hypothetical protein